MTQTRSKVAQSKENAETLAVSILPRLHTFYLSDKHTHIHTKKKKKRGGEGGRGREGGKNRKGVCFAVSGYPDRVAGKKEGRDWRLMLVGW